MQQTFAVNREPRLVLERMAGDLVVSPWEAGSISIETGGEFG